jgi:hypothetical protein
MRETKSSVVMTLSAVDNREWRNSVLGSNHASYMKTVVQESDTIFNSPLPLS